MDESVMGSCTPHLDLFHAGQGVVIGKDSTNAQIVAQIVPALNNNDNCNVILAYSQVKYLVLGQYSSCF